MQDKKVYLNLKQQALLQSRQKTKTFMGGRGAGKSTLVGVANIMRVLNLPRAKGAMVGLTYNQILTKFLPPQMDMWSRMGFKEYISKNDPGHYVVGRMPPKEWPKPYQPPRKYENVISFMNGTCIELISMDRKDTGRGGNYDWMDFDEAVLINKERHDKELISSVRGNGFRFNHHLHGSSIYTSSMPWLPSGNWVPNMKDLADAYPEDYFYLESTCFDNLDVLGKDYPKKLERSLPSIVYQVEVKNKRITKLPNGYYEKFDEAVHTYHQRFMYDSGPRGIFTQRPAGWDTNRRLEVSFDFNAGFNSCIICQETPEGEFRVLKEIYVVGNKVVKDLVDEVCDYYDQYQVCKEVDIYGDATGNRRDAGRAETFFEQIIMAFEARGWNARSMVMRKTNEFHRLRWNTINTILAETDPTKPRIRICREECKGLLISVQSAPILSDFSKDKSSERNLPDDEQMNATHLSDCLDYIVYPKYHKAIEGGNSESMEPVFFRR